MIVESLKNKAPDNKTGYWNNRLCNKEDDK